ncbi:MAG TPA: hypothetical protein VE568_17740 [Rubrobacter sp.]|nr:hypothetical protein [Rubrobacter sp.]
MPKRKGRTVEPTDELGEDSWLKVLELDEYAVRSQNGPESIQEVLFSYLETLQPTLPEYGALV